MGGGEGEVVGTACYPLQMIPEASIYRGYGDVPNLPTNLRQNDSLVLLCWGGLGLGHVSVTKPQCA